MHSTKGRSGWGCWLVLIAFAAAVQGCADEVGTADASRDGGRRDGSGNLDAGDGGEGDASGPREIVVIAPGTPANAADRFRAPPVMDAARSARILYPLDQVLFPRNVWAPDIQWEGMHAMGDLYRVRIEGGPVQLTAYALHTGAGFRNDHPVEAAAWRDLASNSGGRELTLRVDRWDSARNEVVLGASIRIRFARGSIAGAVYYWTLGNFGATQGRIVRVMQGTDTQPRVDNFMPNPPPDPAGARCAACHGLSRNGNLISVSLGDGVFGGVYDVTTDLRGPNPTPVFLYRQPWFFAAFSNDGTRLFMTDSSGGSHLLDGRTGAEIRPSSGALPSATHPAWSPDGNSLAYIANFNDPWNLNTGDLMLMRRTSGDAFSAPTMIHRGSGLMSQPEGGPMDAYPSFSPDSRWIVFQHGTRVLASARGATGAFYIVAPTGGTPVRLGNASGGPTTGDAFYPNFTPFLVPNTDTDMVYWVLLYSRRDYGNALAGTRGTRRRQIWVSAVSSNPTSGDPSFVPYWLPGQEVAQENASAYWAPAPCRANSEACGADSECCSGNCVTWTAAMRACAPPPGSGCRMEGQSCGGAGDCCDRNLSCAAGVCLRAPE